MLIATFGPSTGWVGKTISYEGDQFILEDHGPLTAQQVLSYDDAGQLEWPYAGMRAWVLAQARGGSTAATPETVQARSRSWLYALIAVVVGVVALIVIVAAAGSMRDAVGTADENYQGAVNNLGGDGGASTMVTVFTWPGGGDSNDIRNSSPFQLQGGHQVFAVSATPGTAGYGLSPMLSFTVRPADGRDGMEMVNPPGTGASQSDLYLPAGSYYVSSNTVDCTWTVTISEAR